MKKIFFLIFAFLTFGVDSIFSSERLSLGLGYPYFSLKCHPLELKYATGEGIDVFAGRFYLNFYKKEKVKASLTPKPASKAPDIVAPEREMLGNIAIA